MTAPVLTVSSVVVCAHGGPVVVALPGTAKLHVGVDAVLVVDDLTAATLTCPGVQPGGTGKCTAVTSVVDGELPAKLTVDGSPVVRATVTGTTNGSPSTLKGAADQTALTTA